MIEYADDSPVPVLVTLADERRPGHRGLAWAASASRLSAANPTHVHHICTAITAVAVTGPHCIGIPGLANPGWPMPTTEEYRGSPADRQLASAVSERGLTTQQTSPQAHERRGGSPAARSQPVVGTTVEMAVSTCCPRA